MECTQRLECTQEELYGSQQERTCIEQIGFLGICGTKYPVKKGPNKIGRDPQTCNIVLNLNSVSRQHAVINILNATEYMIMDLDSANKTRLIDKTLPPYIPHPLKNGDTVQFGQVFGVFRLLEEDNDLPMTQALDIPETPVVNRHVSKLNNFPTTTIPESPDVSDKDESFFVPSQSKNRDEFKSPNSHFIKPGKTIAIQPVGTNKIDNIYWNSSKKSVSFDMHLDDSELLEDSSSSLKTTKTVPNQNIHEMDTQVPFPAVQNDVLDTIYTANTQIPANSPLSTNISSLETQLPTIDHLPDIQKIHNQLDMKLDLFIENKDNNNSIYNAETQQFTLSNEPKEINLSNSINIKEPIEDTPKSNHNISDEEIIFDEVTSQPFQDDFASQPLLLPETLDLKETTTSVIKETVLKNSEFNYNNKHKPIKKGSTSDSLSDCEDFDMLPTQKIQEKQDYTLQNQENVLVKNLPTTLTLNISESLKAHDDSTDCEDDVEDNKDKLHKITPIMLEDDDSTDCEDVIIPCNSDALNREGSRRISFEELATQIIATEKSESGELNYIKDKTISELNFEEMPTQVIQASDIQNNSPNFSKSAQESCFEDLPTQVLEIGAPKEAFKRIEISAVKSPFKVPMQFVKKFKKKEMVKPNVSKKLNIPEEKYFENAVMDDDNFYDATQDIFNDLCSQKDPCPPDINMSSMSNNDNETKKHTEPQLYAKTKELLAKDKYSSVNKSLDSSNGDDKINTFVTNLSNQQIKDIIGIDEQKVISLGNVPSDSSDIDSTPKKLRPFTLMETELPNSQEIKTSVTFSSRTSVTETSSDSDVENDTEEQFTPILYRKNKVNKNAKIDLTKKFEVEKLPTRVITRVRKPTAKVQDGTAETKNAVKNILKPRFITEQEENIDKEIITENISRLKGKTDKYKNDGYCRQLSDSKTNDDLSMSKQVKLHTAAESEHSLKSRDIDEKGKRSKSKNNVKLKSNGSEYASEKINVNQNFNNKKPNETTKHDSGKVSETKRNEKNKSIETKKDNKSKNKSKEFLQNNDKNLDILCKNSLDTVGSKETETIHKNIAKLSESKIIVNESGIKRTPKEEITRSSSRTRNTSSKNETESTEKGTNSRTKVSNKRDRRKRNHQDSSKDESSPEKEIRRSKRQRTAKNTSEANTIPNTKSNKPEKHEQSTVYSISSESGIDSPKDKNFKRPSTNEIVLNVKKTRSVTTSKSDNNASLRATPRNIKTHCVLFTAFPCEEVKVKLEKLGAVIVTDVMACTVLLTLQIKRTFKLLCAVGLGRPIVGPSWVQACADTNMIVDPWLYLIKDETTEKRFQFNLERTLIGKRNFLKGYNVSSTPNVMPNTMEMKLIVECSGGTWKEEGPKWICVSCSADKSLWPSLKRRGATVVSTEFILGGVLRQKLDIDRNKLA